MELTITATPAANATKTAPLMDFKVSFTHSFDVKDTLKAEGFTFNENAKAWEKTLTLNAGTSKETMFEALAGFKAMIENDVKRFNLGGFFATGPYTLRVIPIVFTNYAHDETIKTGAFYTA